MMLVAISPGAATMATNPYATPQASLLDAVPRLTDREAQATRAANFPHEAGLRAIGVACLVFGGVLLAFGGSALTYYARSFGVEGGAPRDAGSAMIAFGALFFGGIGLVGAWGYFRLQPWVRWVGIPLALTALVASLGLATPVVLHAAWLTWSRAGRTILSPAFAAVLARAPGRPDVWQLGHAVAMVAMVALYVAAFYGVMQLDAGDD
jgi:hypothetical protein